MAVAETRGDAAAEAVGEGEVVLRVEEEFVHEAGGFVADVAVVFAVEAGCEDRVGEFALVAPVVWMDC